MSFYACKSSLTSNNVAMLRTFQLIVFLAFITGCSKEQNPEDSQPIKYGKNEFTTQVDGISRNYIVSVPQRYDGKTSIPVVFMLHGSGGNGGKFYDDSGWKELGERENILTVFPSGLISCNVDEGIQSTGTKWNSQPTNNWQYCANVPPPDDVKFLGQVIDELQQKYTIDTKRIYFVGFSNGGQMCAKLSILLSNRIAAIVECSGSFNIDSTLTFTPLRRLPISYQLGNRESGAGAAAEVPLSKFETILNTPGYKPYIVQKTHVRIFDLNPTYTISGDTTSIVYATFTPKNGNPVNNFNFAFVKGLDHEYPNGVNHWMRGAEVHWNWLKQFSLP